MAPSYITSLLLYCSLILTCTHQVLLYRRHPSYSLVSGDVSGYTSSSDRQVEHRRHRAGFSVLSMCRNWRTRSACRVRDVRIVINQSINQRTISIIHARPRINESARLRTVDQHGDTQPLNADCPPISCGLQHHRTNTGHATHSAICTRAPALAPKHASDTAFLSTRAVALHT
jgi:hypothetical protein